MALESRKPDQANPLTHFVIVRKDLPRGLQGAMLVHAAGESSPGNLPEDTHAIVLSVPDEPDLAALGERLKKFDVAHVVVREPDPPWNGAMMAIGVVPARREELRKHFSCFPLLK